MQAQPSTVIRGWIKGVEGANVTADKLKTFTDSDYASSLSRRSRTGYAIYLGNNLLSWRSRRQSVVSLSTCEAELYALCDGAKETMRLSRLLYEMINRRLYEDHVAVQPAELRCDNKSTISVAKESGRIPKVVKHIATRTKWVCERVQDNEFVLEYVTSQENVADLFTKTLKPERFKALVKKLNMDMVDQ